MLRPVTFFLTFVAMDTLFGYLDYRRFLEDHYNACKQGNYFFSYRFMAGKLGVDASNLVKILQGKRHLPRECIDKAVAFCKLDDREAQFFEALYRFNKAKSDKAVKSAYEKLLALKYVPGNTVRRDQYEFYQKWYYSAVRSLLGLYRFTGSDFAGLGQKLTPAITATQARQAIRLLERLDLITRDESGRYLPTDRHVTTGEGWRGAAVRAFQKECIGLSQDALDSIPRGERDISSITMAVPRSGLDEIREIVSECRKAIIARVNEMEKPDTVYQLNIQFIPLSRPEEKSNESDD